MQARLDLGPGSRQVNIRVSSLLEMSMEVVPRCIRHTIVGNKFFDCRRMMDTAIIHDQNTAWSRIRLAQRQLCWVSK
jgi:hypothetical protein